MRCSVERDDGGKVGAKFINGNSQSFEHHHFTLDLRRLKMEP